MSITIYYDPGCEVCRDVLALIRNSGREPRIVEFLKTPPTRAELADLIRRMDVPVRAVLHRAATADRGAPLGPDDPMWSDEDLLDLVLKHPALLGRPIVVSPLGVRLCRPAQAVLSVLADEQGGPFSKQSGERVIDDQGRRVDKPGPSRRAPFG